MLMLRMDADNVMDRTKHFYASEEKGALIQVRNIRSIRSTPDRSLKGWNLPDNLKEYLDACIDTFTDYWLSRQSVDDDLIPALSPWYGISEHTAFIGGSVEFSDTTSWHKQYLTDFNNLCMLKLEEDNVWLRAVADGIRYMKQKLAGRAAVKLRGGSCPLDIANALRGNEIFTDFYDDEYKVHELLEFCTIAEKWMFDHQLEAAGDFYGGVISGFDVWLPGHSVGHLAEDTSCLCSPDIYMEFGLPYTKKLLEGYDCAFMHTHALGRHSLSHIASIEKIKFIEISSDPNCERAIEIYKKMAEVLKDKIVIVELTYDEIKDNLEFLKNSRTIIWHSARDIDEAMDTVKLVREHLSICRN
jgi:hypothetical protein